MTYLVRLWCRDCTGEDPAGCFDGGTEFIPSEDGDDAQEFETIAAAKDAGYSATKNCGLWEYEVTDEEGEDLPDELLASTP